MTENTPILPNNSTSPTEINLVLFNFTKWLFNAGTRLAQTLTSRIGPTLSIATTTLGMCEAALKIGDPQLLPVRRQIEDLQNLNRVNEDLLLFIARAHAEFTQHKPGLETPGFRAYNHDFASRMLRRIDDAIEKIKQAVPDIRLKFFESFAELQQKYDQLPASMLA